jgi:hypothetical protein
MHKILTTTLIGSLLAAFGATALAQTTSTMPKDRDTVRAEAGAATKAGENPAGERSVPPPKKAMSTKTRDEVKAETRAASASEVNRAGERSVPPPKKAMSTKSREDVKAETRDAKAKGQLLKPGEIASQPRS